MVLVANKSDLEKDRQVSTSEGKLLAQELKVRWIECLPHSPGRIR
jgi:hypothetical protein